LIQKNEQMLIYLKKVYSSYQKSHFKYGVLNTLGEFIRPIVNGLEHCIRPPEPMYKVAIADTKSIFKLHRHVDFDVVSRGRPIGYQRGKLILKERILKLRG
jgi:hypothetical protein